MSPRDISPKQAFGLGLKHLVYLVIAFIFVLPLWWAIVSSLRPNGAIFADIFPFTPKALLPTPFTLEAYSGVFERGFGQIIANTMLVATITMVAGLIVNGAAGFAFAMFDFKGKKLVLSAIIISFMLPFEAIALPLYTVTQQLGWLDNIAALIVPSVANGLAVFLFYQFFSQVPKDYAEAARLDGVTGSTSCCASMCRCRCLPASARRCCCSSFSGKRSCGRCWRCPASSSRSSRSGWPPSSNNIRRSGTSCSRFR
jgi:ABC-type glycerol-3-phosphate transport system permease component